MKITWFGQACFELVTRKGTVIICDPYHPRVGYAAHPRAAHVVTISHEHGDHNETGWISGSPAILRGTGHHEAGEVVATGLPSFHDDHGGANRGLNTVFLIDADGLRLCHLGDLGHEPDDALYAAIGRPDVLFIPAGGYYTVEPNVAAAIARRIGAGLTIPMHFKPDSREVPIATVDAFAEATGAVRHGGPTVDVEPGYAGPSFAVLDYLREETGE